jgi:4-alpha-glucanotransferase
MSDARSASLRGSALDQLALAQGIDLKRPTPDGETVEISDDTKRKILRALDVELTNDQTSLPVGRNLGARVIESATLCFVPDLLVRERIWGVSLQLYELRSQRNWGIGDFEDLRVAIDLVASLGGDFIGLNPLHAPFLADAGRCSPYEPSSRLFLNPLYIAIDKLPGFRPDTEQRTTIDALRATDLVAYEAVALTKLSALRSIWARWKDTETSDYNAADFEAFVGDGGNALLRHVLFETLSAYMVQSGFSAGWHSWPKEFQDPDASTVASFAAEHDDDIRFHLWLQWVTHRQLAEVAAHACASGLRIGLYLDLAVGEALDGSATWSERKNYLTDATIGSPPDPFAPDGQDWHLAGFQPSRIASGEAPPFERMVTAAMQYAGAIRIDHAAALRRAFLVPIDGTPSEGAYVTYPQEDLIQILVETSAQHRCLVIGEDLGLLPNGLQDDLTAANILSYRILSYERDDEGFKPATDYPALALACISTHDHQTLAGWWRGADIALRAKHGIVSPELTQQHLAARKVERQQLIQALGIPDGDGLADNPPSFPLDDITIRAHRFVAETPSMLVAVRLADLTDEKLPTNVPGTSSSYPNWQPKLSVSIERLSELTLLWAISDAMNEGRQVSLSRRGLVQDNRGEQNPSETSDASRQPGGVNGTTETDAKKLDAIVEKYADKLPRPMGRFIRWMRRPEWRWLRL